ncbi:serine protease snake-like isoform X2 [Trichoplusia ni]|uniref:Serine protease snake-like isoform X2 n=1 Tax=Trichoplusia ni TaxID=7111 RepID=A0A7E5WUJ5_TRINI|nr:serine protease snake-like isoform X2 [Trichoplusia ni]
MWNDMEGVCVNFYRCFSAPEYVKNRTHPPICSFDGNVPIICCTDCLFFQDLRKIRWNNNIGFLRFNGPKSKDKCLNYVDALPYPDKTKYTAKLLKHLDPNTKCYVITQSIGRINTPLPPRKAAYMAHLANLDDIGDVKFLCAGAIISERFVLTAGHCVSGSVLGPVKYIAVDFMKTDTYAPLWQLYTVKRTVPHPDYQLPSKYHDIALVETKKIDLVLPACLYMETFDRKRVREIIKASTVDNQNNLEPATLEELDDFACSFLYPTRETLPKGFNTTIQTCFGSTGEADSCQSATGGPLMSEHLAVSCAPLVYGVTASDRICGPAGSSGLYTRVSYYVPWIESIVWH